MKSRSNNFQKSLDIDKVISVAFSCTTSYHIDAAEKMYNNWKKLYNEDGQNRFVESLIEKKRRWYCE